MYNIYQVALISNAGQQALHILGWRLAYTLFHYFCKSHYNKGTTRSLNVATAVLDSPTIVAGLGFVGEEAQLHTGLTQFKP